MEGLEIFFLNSRLGAGCNTALSETNAETETIRPNRAKTNAGIAWLLLDAVGTTIIIKDDPLLVSVPSRGMS